MELTKNQLYYLANKEKFLERARQRRERDPEAIKAYQAGYFQKVTKVKRAANRKPRVIRPKKPRAAKIKIARTKRRFLSPDMIPFNPAPEPLPPPAPCFRWPGITLTWD